MQAPLALALQVTRSIRSLNFPAAAPASQLPGACMTSSRLKAISITCLQAPYQTRLTFAHSAVIRLACTAFGSNNKVARCGSQHLMGAPAAGFRKLVLLWLGQHIPRGLALQQGLTLLQLLAQRAQLLLNWSQAAGRSCRLRQGLHLWRWRPLCLLSWQALLAVSLQG